MTAYLSLMRPTLGTMARHVSEDRRRAAALQAGRRLIARGERPMYRLLAQDGYWTVEGLPWITMIATTRREALAAACSAIAEWLEVGREAFDLN